MHAERDSDRTSGPYARAAALDCPVNRPLPAHMYVLDVNGECIDHQELHHIARLRYVMETKL